jgi:Protein of unknown function (DUF2939)
MDMKAELAGTGTMLLAAQPTTLRLHLRYASGHRNSISAMRMTLSISAALVALWLAYAVSPFVSVYRLVGAVENRDIAALSARVDFRALSGSLAAQIARMYLIITGKLLGEPGSLREQLAQQLAVGVAASIADEIVENLVSPQGLLEFLRTGGPPVVESDGLPMPGGLTADALDQTGEAVRVVIDKEGTTFH